MIILLGVTLREFNQDSACAPWMNECDHGSVCSGGRCSIDQSDARIVEMIEQ